MIPPVAVGYMHTRSLRSASKFLLDALIARDTKSKRYGHRAFKLVARTLWNSVLENIREKKSESQLLLF
jgi:hypothetical protein